MFKIWKFQGVIIEDNGFPRNSRGVREKMVWNSMGLVKNEIEFQGIWLLKMVILNRGVTKNFWKSPIVEIKSWPISVATKTFYAYINLIKTTTRNQTSLHSPLVNVVFGIPDVMIKKKKRFLINIGKGERDFLSSEWNKSNSIFYLCSVSLGNTRNIYFTCK